MKFHPARFGPRLHSALQLLCFASVAVGLDGCVVHHEARSPSAPGTKATVLALPPTPAAARESNVPARAVPVNAPPPIVATPHSVRRAEVQMEPPHAPPQILSVALSRTSLHAGEVVTGVVTTSSNVASVEARVAGYGQTLQRTSVGRFTMSYRVPDLPLFLRRTYSIQVIARNSDGAATVRAVPVEIR